MEISSLRGVKVSDGICIVTLTVGHETIALTTDEAVHLSAALLEAAIKTVGDLDPNSATIRDMIERVQPYQRHFKWTSIR